VEQQSEIWSTSQVSYVYVSSFKKTRNLHSICSLVFPQVIIQCNLSNIFFQYLITVLLLPSPLAFIKLPLKQTHKCKNFALTFSGNITVEPGLIKNVVWKMERKKERKRKRKIVDITWWNACQQWWKKSYEKFNLILYLSM
jgi:hypothetical protein